MLLRERELHSIEILKCFFFNFIYNFFSLPDLINTLPTSSFSEDQTSDLLFPALTGQFFIFIIIIFFLVFILLLLLFDSPHSQLGRFAFSC